MVYVITNPFGSKCIVQTTKFQRTHGSTWSNNKCNVVPNATNVAKGY